MIGKIFPSEDLVTGEVSPTQRYYVPIFRRCLPPAL